MKIENNEVDRIAKNIMEITAPPYQTSLRSQRLSPEWRKAGQRWLTNTSIIQVLSDALRKPRMDIIEVIAAETTGLVFEEEIKVAVQKGIELLGPSFEHKLIEYINQRIVSSGNE